MFSPSTYIKRRNILRERIGRGVILFVGNCDSPMNYAHNAYPFRQDSSFLYYFGLDSPRLAAVVDVDEGREILFGDDLTVDDIIWTGPKPSLAERREAVGVKESASWKELNAFLQKSIEEKRPVHFLPQYRSDNVLRLCALLKASPILIERGASVDLIRAVVAQRSIKSEEEVREIETALEISYEMQTLAMRMAKPGMYEREVAGAMEGLVLSRGSRLAFPTIFSIHGETLHNLDHENVMNEGDIAVNDSGVESPMHYASDITRTVPIRGRFTLKQKEIYSVVLRSQEAAIEAIRPGVEYRDVHRLSAEILCEGLADLGLVKGDPKEAVEAGAHTLFFQCGVGHMLGLDVHDMEGLGEEYVGYTDAIQRNTSFGWNCLRLGRALEEGFVVTVEPGIYFIPELINRWKAENHCADFINYERVEDYRDFGGIRIEDDVLVVRDGYRVLGQPIPKSIDDVEEMCMSS